MLNSYGQCYLENSAYQPGEKIQYEVYYNWGFIWLNAGWVNFEVKETLYNNRECYFFDAYGASHESYDWIYKVRDRLIAYLDKETLQSQYFHRVNSEGGYEVDNKYIFNWQDTLVYSFTQNSNKPYSEDTLSVPACAFDVLSFVYYTRDIDFSKLKIGETFPIISILDNEIFNLYIRYLGKEVIKDRKGVRHSCIKISALLIEGTIFKGGEDMYIWVTDDANRVPVLVEAKILIGSIKAYLSKAEGLRN